MRVKIAQTFRAGLEEPALGQIATSTACFTAVRSREDANNQRGIHIRHRTLTR